MKTFKRTSLPETINHNKRIYTRVREDIDIKNISSLRDAHYILVEVLSTNLKGLTDLHGAPYKPTVFAYRAPLK